MDRFIRTITRAAGTAVMKKFGKVGVKYMKSEALWDCVTEADLLADSMIVKAIKKNYPTHGIISEESGRYQSEAEYVWVIDPIDGTFNFANGAPQFGVMVCLMRKGEVVLSAIDLPASKELFFAKKGWGAFLNGKRIHCSRRRRVHNSFGTGSSSIRTRTAKLLLALIKAAKKEDIQFASMASMAMNACYAACGRRDWMIALTGALHDFAPVGLILSEAGCKVTDTKGRTWKPQALEIVAANPSLHKELLKLTKGV
ncbi:MAG: inositol monophosphatase [Candidatus Kaiserbacteria bacterium]|nr:MAG: inositol monophosphatase [Candidatus Kaiserbacteria bacterium]